jgi:peptidoglycan/xylan/chitin deacetylase (PgdA/CDA1 family)
VRIATTKHIEQGISGRRLIVGLVAAFSLLAAWAAVPVSALAAQTVVSLTFDDGTATQYWALGQLQQHGMMGTFYVNSARVGTSSYYMTWPQIHDLYNAGNEIGGHTADHDNLPQTDPTEAQRQVCQDRVNLINEGFQPTDFAYPYGAYNSTIQQMVKTCGYNSARSSSLGAETIPPADPYAIRIGGDSSNLTTLEAAVTNAENSGGGWVPLVFHQICNGCDTNWITQSDFTSLLDWLQTQSGVVVKRVQDVIGGSMQPAVAGPGFPAAPNGFNVLHNTSLEYNSGGGAPDCFVFDGFGNNDAVWSQTTDAHSGTYAERVDVSNYSDGDAKLVMRQDLGQCTPSVTPGHSYVASVWYKSSTPVYFTAFSRDQRGAFSFWTGSNTFPASSTWAHAVWTTGTVPNGVTGLSFGLTIASAGFLTVDDFGFQDASPTGSADATPPTVSIVSPTSGSSVAGTVPVTANASDNVAVDHVDFFVDGLLVGSTDNGLYVYNWATNNVANGSHTLAARAVDTSGNATTTTAMPIVVANSGVNLLQNPSLENASGSTPTCWLLGGYGTNTFAWTRTSDAHTGSWAENLNVSAWTNGDRKLVSAEDSGTCAPAARPGHSYTVSAWYKVPSGVTAKPLFFAYYRNSSGSWVYWAQSATFASNSSWTQVSWTTSAVPSGATNLSVGMGLNNTGSVTLDDLSLTDNTPPPDTTPPTSSITCDGLTDAGGCAPGWYPGAVEVALQASDNPGGSGVASIRYTTDGSEPSLTNGVTYSGPFSVTSTTTVKYRAYDEAGNAENVHTQLIQVDSIPPSSTISCNGASCQSGFYNAATSVTLAATDSGGSGVATIRYTTDGSEPTATNGKAYLGSFSLSATTTVKYRAYDNAGNAEAVNTQLIQIDTTPPTSTIACNNSPCTQSSYVGSVSVSLAAEDNGGGAGIAQIVYTTDGSEPSGFNGTAYIDPFTLTSTTTVKYRAYDNAGNAESVNAQTINVSPPQVTVTSPTAGSTVSGNVTLSATVSGIAVDHVNFLVDGNLVGTVTTSPYTMTWDSTQVPDGQHTVVAQAYDASNNMTASAPTTVSVSNGAPDTIPPTSTIACNGTTCSSGFYDASVSVSLSATDNPGGSGVASIVYTTNGSEPTSTNGTTYGGPFSVGATKVVKYRAYDNAGNAEAVNTQTISIDTVAPSSSISCNGAGCASSFYTQAVSVTLSATDNTGGSGVSSIVYTTDGSEPSTTNGTTYAAAFTISATTTVKYRAYDNARNAEPVNSSLIQIDTTPPTSTIACNGGSCAGWFKPGASVSLSASDNQGGSGVASIRYTTNGTDPSLTNGRTYSSPFTVNATTTVKYRAYDNAGNAETVNTQAVQIDGTAPSVALSAPSAGSLAAGTVALTANASDNVGVDHVDFLVDGNVVGTSTSSPYAFNWQSTSVGDGSHSLAARAVDLAGNATTSSAVSVTVTNNNLLQNPSLENASGSTPTCWLLGGYGTNTFAWTRTSDAHTGSWAENLNVSAWTNGDRKLVSAEDSGTCAPAARPGHSYTVSAWYKVPSGVTAKPLFFAYYRNSSGSWVYWAQSATFASNSSWTQVSWTTSAVPSGATNLSVGMGLNNTGSVTLDDLGLFATG